MSQTRRWGARIAARLSRLAGRLDERRAAAAREAEPELDVSAELPRTVYVPAPPSRPPAVGAARSARDESVAWGARPAPAEAVPWGVRVAAEAGWRFLVLAAALYVLMRAISAVQLVILAFTAAVLITALLQPTVSRLRRLGLPRGLATAVTFIGGFVVIGLVGWFVVWQVTENIDTLSTRLQDGIVQLKQWLLTSPLHVTNSQINQIVGNLNNAIGTNVDQITSVGLQGVTVIFEALTGVFLAMFSTLFLLYDGRNVWRWALKLFPTAAREGMAGAGPRAWRTLTLYVRGTVIVAFIDAVCIGIGLYVINVPMAVPLAVIIFLGAFVPLVGAVASGALAMIVALVTQGPFAMLMVLLVVLAVQQIEGHVLQPFILGRAVRVHPLAVVLSVAAGGLIAGVGGAVVAVPLVAVVNTVVGYLHAHSREAALRQVLTAGVPHPVEPEDPEYPEYQEDPEDSGRGDGVEAAAGSED